MKKSIFHLYNNREVRVFISSTFRDMMEEREYLVKQIFPILRKKYADRGVTITEIDLRWGVLEEEAENGKVIDICLNEIDKSRPYFIGLLGERYGWIPDDSEYKKHKKIVEDFEWVVEDIESNLSITEMEVQYGVLRNPEMHKKSAFFLRDSENENSKLFKELAGSKEEEKLKLLKEKIENEPGIVSRKYSDVTELGKQVIEHLSSLIETDFPLLDDKIKKILPQLNFINARRKVYIKEEKYFGLISDHIERTSSPIVITGKTGSGVSSLLANYLNEYAEKNPNDILLFNFSSASEGAANHLHVLKRFCEELTGREINLQEEFTENSAEKLTNYFEELLTQTTPGKVLLVMDGLDELDDTDNSLLLHWLPNNYNPNVKVIYSCGAGETLERLKKRRYEVIHVAAPDKDAKQKLINNYLLEFSKKLPKQYVESIVDDDISDLPLTLKSCLDELRQFGLHEQLSTQINYYTSAEGPVQFYNRILQRLENDYEVNNTGLIENIFTLLHNSKTGLTETEILEILEIPPLYWTPVYNNIESSITNMNGYLSIAHKYLREAVKNRYIENSEKHKTVSKKIINYFIADRYSTRAMQETAHQFILLDDKKGLFDLLSNIDIVITLFTSEKNQLQLFQYWRGLAPDYLPADVYSPAKLLEYIEQRNYNFKEAITIISLFGMLFKDLGNYETAEKYFETVYDWSKDKLDENDDFLRASLARLVLICLDINKVEKAEKYAVEAVSICDKYLEKTDINYIAAYSNLGLVLSAKEKYSDAIKIYRDLLDTMDKSESNTIKERTNILNNLASAYFNSNSIDNSIKIYEEVIRLEEEYFGIENPENITALSNLGFVYSEVGNYQKAHLLFDKCIKIGKKIYGESHPNTISIFFNFIDLLFSEDNYDLAEEYLDKIENLIGRDNADDEKHGRLFHLKAQLKSIKEDYENAIELERKALLIFKEKLGEGHRSSINSLFNLAAFYLNKNRFDEAEEIIAHAEKIIKDKNDESDIRLAEVYNLYGGLFKEKGDFDSAEDYIRRGLELRIDILGETHKDTIKNIQNFAVILYTNKKIEDAKNIIEYSLQVIEKKYGKDSLRYCENLEIINEILSEQKEYDLLETNLLHIYDYYEKTYGQNHRLTYNTLVRIINIKKELSHNEQVILLLPKVIDRAKQIWNEDDLEYQNMLLDTAMRYADYKKYSEAINLFNELYEIQIKYNGEFDNSTLLTLNNIASTKKLNGDLEGADKDFENLFNSIDENKIEYNDEILDCLSNYARIKLETGDLKKAEEFYQVGLNTAKKLFGLKNFKTVDHLYYLAELYAGAGEIKKAESLYSDYLNELTPGDEETEKIIIEVMRLLANVIAPEKDYAKLEPLLKARAELSEKVFGINTKETIKALLVLSTNYQLKEDYKNSVEILNRIASECESETLYTCGENYVKIYTDLISFYNGTDENKKSEKPVNENWKEEAELNKKQISAAEAEGDIRKVLEILADNIELYELNLGLDHPDTVFCKRDYANKLIEVNQFKFANEILSEVLGKIKASLGVDHSEYTITLYSLAKTEQGLGKLNEALINFKKVKDQAAAGLESSHPFLYDVDKKIADTYFNMIKNEESLQLYNQLLETIADSNPVERAYLMLQISQLYIRLQKYDDAVNYINEAEIFYAAEFEENNPYSIMIPDLKGNIYWNKNELETAEKYYLEAVANAKKILPPDHPAYIKTMKTIALFYFNNNRFSESLNFHTELLENYMQTYPPEDLTVVEQKLTLALIYHNLEMHDEAIELLSEAIEAEPDGLSENSHKMMVNLYNYYSAEE